MKNYFILLMLWVGNSAAIAQFTEIPIRINQVGYHPNGPKTAAVISESNTGFLLREIGTEKIVFRGRLSAPRTVPHSGRIIQIADFTDFKKSGQYALEVPGLPRSSSFQIAQHVYENAGKAAAKAFYYQRASTALPEKYAGKWAREEGHPDEHVLIHSSAASPARPAGHVISSPRGWYDAGDYNKYIVNSAITVATLLSVTEDFPALAEKRTLNIPESGDALPDLLNEILWNLRWMLTMQDPIDGGVYHKLTNAAFDGMKIKPENARNPRFVVQKSTTASLGFAAVTAHASRVLLRYHQQLPGLADSCLAASAKAWAWAKKHPTHYYRQEELNKLHSPAISTGTYGDPNAEDEWFWAAAELYLATGSSEYLPTPIPDASVPTWNRVSTLGLYNLAGSGSLAAQAKAKIIKLADDLVSGIDSLPYRMVMGKTRSHFVWGSSAVAANQGIVLLKAFRLTNKTDYLKAACFNLDYLLGKNATGYSFLTGFGSKKVMHPHHRLAESDDVAEPLPGFLSGGPNPGQQDKLSNYPNNYPDESFVDDAKSYASNEIAINWNAPLVYLLWGVEAVLSKK